MRRLVLLAGVLAVPAWADCPAAPTGSTADTVVQMLANGGTAGIGPVAKLTATKEGALVYDSGVNQLKYCDGTNWNPILTSNAATVPTGAVMAFDATTCPSGWSEYTAARGRFLRGIDNGAGLDPDGTRAAGSQQADAFQGHAHFGSSLSYITVASGNDGSGNNRKRASYSETAGTVDAGYGTPRVSTETRPVNVAVLFCRKN
jgi:hypothetical protein